MSDDPAERLKQFRASNTSHGANRSGTLLLLLVIVCGFAVLGTMQVLLFKRGQQQAPAAENTGGLTTEQLRQYAVRLEEKKLSVPAIEAYEEYLGRAQLDDKTRANTCFSVAKLAMDAQQYEKALTYLYQTEMLQPESELKDDINKKVVSCLDKLNRSTDLRRELRKRTDLKRKPEDVGKDEVVLAEFAGEVITDRDLDLEIEKLPPYARESVDTPEKRADMLKNLVAQRLLLDKALRMELDKDPEIQESLADERDAMIVRKLIGDEVKAKVHITPEDVERFYKAEPARFTEPASAEVFAGKADTEEAAKALTVFPEKPVTIRKGSPAPGLSLTPEAEEAIFAAEPNTVIKPFQIDKAWCVFKVASKKAENLLPFEQVKEQATRAFQMQKEQEQIRVLIDETLQARDVNLHLDRLKEDKEQQEEKKEEAKMP